MTSIDWRIELADQSLRRRYLTRLLVWWLGLGVGWVVVWMLYAVSYSSLPPGQIDKAHHGIVQIQQAIEIYRVKKRGTCPRTYSDLVAAAILSRVPKDPWGEPYRFDCDADDDFIGVSSAGPDGEFATDDDITNLDPY